MGFRIFLHSVGLVFKQLRGALRISGVLYLVTVAAGVITLVFFEETMTSTGQPSFSWHLALLSVFAGLIYLWIAVGWHRFILVNEVPNRPVPELHGDRMLAYFGRFLQSALICMAIGAVFMAIAFALVAITKSSSVILMLLPLVLILVLFLLSYRLAPMLPGAAIGQSIGVRAAWAATRGASGALIWLAIISTIVVIVIELPVALLPQMPAGTALVFVWASVTGWIKLMVGISILTTIYGVYVEKRELAQ